MKLNKLFQKTDIYIIDQILKDRFDTYTSVLDVGCGTGRNLAYFLQNNFDVFAIDLNTSCIDEAKKLALSINRACPSTNFVVGAIENIPFQQSFDLIICNAVLHFAKNKIHFEEMLFSIWQKLAPNGTLFIRLASSIGIEQLVTPVGNGNFKLPDGSTRYLVSEKNILDYTQQLGATLLEPIKTTNVQSLRCMTTWILKKDKF